MGQYMTYRHFFRLFSCCIAEWKLVSFLLIGAMLLSCSGYPVRSDRSRGVYHRVKSGETLWAASWG